MRDIKYLKQLLPLHYKCINSKHPLGINCTSEVGINDTDPEHWFFIFEAIKQHFKERFIEVNHITCTNHKNFTVYIRNSDE